MSDVLDFRKLIIGPVAELIILQRIPLLVSAVLAAAFFDFLVAGSMREAIRYALIDAPVQLVGITIALSAVCYAIHFTGAAMLNHFDDGDRSASSFENGIACYLPTFCSLLISLSVGIPFIRIAADPVALIVESTRLISALAGTGFICIGIVMGFARIPSLHHLTDNETVLRPLLKAALALVPLGIVLVVSGAFFGLLLPSIGEDVSKVVASKVTGDWFSLLTFLAITFAILLALRASLDVIFALDDIRSQGRVTQSMRWFLPRVVTALITLALTWNFSTYSATHAHQTQLWRVLNEFIVAPQWTDELDLALRVWVLTFGVGAAGLLSSGLLVRARLSPVNMLDRFSSEFAERWDFGSYRLSEASFLWKVLFATLFSAAVGIAFFAVTAVAEGSASGTTAGIGVITVMLAWGFAMTMLFFPIAYMAHEVRLPLMSGLLVLALVFSGLDLNDNHAIRILPEASPTNEAPAQAANRFGADFEFAKWLGSRKDRSAYERYPVFIIATEGGGMRAAYFTASVLGAIQDVCPSFAQHIVAISGVSGGSVGAAVFNATAANLATNYDFRNCGDALKESAGDPDQTSGPFPFVTLARSTLAQDFLSPLLGAMLFPDALQRVIPYPIKGFDRAYALERALESAWFEACQRVRDQGGGILNRAGTAGALCNPGRMARPFADLYPHGPHQTGLPNTFFNTTEVASGRIAPLVSTGRLLGRTESQARIVRAVLAKTPSVSGKGFPTPADMQDLVSPLNTHLTGASRVPLSTAALVSARFPYLTPAARVDDGKTGIVSRFVDGGYFENSGTWIATAFARNLLDQSKRPIVVADATMQNMLANVDIYVIVVGSNPPCRPKRITTGNALADCEPADGLAARGGNELLSPIRALLNARSARADYSRLDLILLAQSLKKACPELIDPTSTIVAPCPTLSVLELSFKNGSGEEVPLTWLLSSQARQSMDKAVDSMVGRMACILGEPTGQWTLMRPKFSGLDAIRAERIRQKRDADTVEGNLRTIVDALMGKKIGETPLSDDPCARLEGSG